MKTLSLIILFLSLALANAQEGDFQKQRTQAEEDAEKAIGSLRQLFTTITEADFSKSEKIEQDLKLNSSLTIPKGTTKKDALNRKIQVWVSQIDLAQDYTVTKFSGQETVNQLLRGKDYYGVSISSDFDAFDKQHRLIKQLFDDPDLLLGDRFFGLMQTGKDDSEAAARKWIAFVKLLSDANHFGASFDKQTATLYRSLKGITILRGVTNSKKFQTAVNSSGELKGSYEFALNDQLKTAAFKFAQSRYRQGGLLRDWSLPVGETIVALYPEESRESIGITTQQEYLKYTLAHARALTELIEHFNANKWSSKFVNRSLTSINDYRSKSFYIGSTEVRESGTLKVPKDEELELLLANAEWFGPDGHLNIERYKAHSNRLDQIFTGSDGKANFEGLMALKSPKQWISFFDYELFGRKNKNSVFSTIKSEHAITSRGIKVLFLARLILPSDRFQSAVANTSGLTADYDSLVNRLEVEVKASASEQFRNFSSSWGRVQNGYMELAKGFPNYSFDRLNLTTSSKLKVVRRGFDKAMEGNESVPVLLQKLFAPNNKYLASSMEQMTSSAFRDKTGRYDMRLTPEFVDAVNDSLIDIVEYRTNGFAAVDSLERPDAKAGKIMSHFKVSDYRLPGKKKSNTVIHDLICGPQGGFGGLGVLFDPTLEGYKKRESVYDGIVAAENLKLGDILFSLALDVKRDPDYDAEQLGLAAKRWFAYFKQSQSNAHFNPTDEVLKEAVRGTYLSRLVFQSESFRRAMENSSTAPVGSAPDIGLQFESAVSSQVKKMQGMLSRIDPETASNRNIDETKAGWFRVKAWYVESVKWLETILDDPLMAKELSRLRDLNRKEANYHILSPEVVIFEKNLDHFGGEIFSKPNIPFSVGMANFGIEEVIKLEDDLNESRSTNQSTEEAALSNEQEEFGKMVSREFLNEIRDVVRKQGFEKMASARTQTELQSAFRKAVSKEASRIDEQERSVQTDRAKVVERAFEASIAKAISRIEAEQPSELRLLYDQMVRGAKVDKYISKDLPSHKRLDIAPSLILAKWVETDRVETLANFRTREISAEAQEMVIKARSEKQSMEEVRRQLESARDQSALKIDKLKEWMEGSQSGAQVSVDDMMEDYLAMQEEIALLKKENLILADSEANVRAQAAQLAQQLMQLKNGDKLAAAAYAQAQTASQDDPSYTSSSPSNNFNSSTAGNSYTNSSSSYTKPKPSTSTWKPPAQSYTKPSQSSSGGSGSSANNRNFFQKLFKRKQR